MENGNENYRRWDDSFSKGSSDFGQLADNAPLIVQSVWAEYSFRRPPDRATLDNVCPKDDRVGIARTLAVEPEVVLFHEMTNAQIQNWSSACSILWPISEMRHDDGCGHARDGSCHQAPNQVIVMGKERVVEADPADSIIDNPQSPRLRRLLAEMLRVRRENDTNATMRALGWARIAAKTDIARYPVQISPLSIELASRTSSPARTKGNKRNILQWPSRGSTVPMPMEQAFCLTIVTTSLFALNN